MKDRYLFEKVSQQWRQRVDDGGDVDVAAARAAAARAARRRRKAKHRRQLVELHRKRCMHVAKLWI